MTKIKWAEWWDTESRNQMGCHTTIEECLREMRDNFYPEDIEKWFTVLVHGKDGFISELGLSGPELLAAIAALPPEVK